MPKRSRLMKKHGGKALCLLVLLGVLGWLSYLTVQQSKMEAEHKALMQ